MHGISWSLVQRMLIDAPRLEDGDSVEQIDAADNPDDFVKAINNMIN
jgi:hypothetical protein